MGITEYNYYDIDKLKLWILFDASDYAIDTKL